MSKTYTEHYGLTDPMLKRLSAICNERTHGHGVSLIALEDRGLVVERENSTYPVTHEATPAGHAALAQARREGW